MPSSESALIQSHQLSTISSN